MSRIREYSSSRSSWHESCHPPVYLRIALVPLVKKIAFSDTIHSIRCRPCSGMRRFRRRCSIPITRSGSRTRRSIGCRTLRRRWMANQGNRVTVRAALRLRRLPHGSPACPSRPRAPPPSGGFVRPAVDVRLAHHNGSSPFENSCRRSSACRAIASSVTRVSHGSPTMGSHQPPGSSIHEAQHPVSRSPSASP